MLSPYPKDLMETHRVSALVTSLPMTIRRTTDRHLFTYPDPRRAKRATGQVLYIGHVYTEALLAIRPAEQLLDRNATVFGLSARQIGRRVQAAAKATGLGDGYTGHSGRSGIAQDLVKNGWSCPPS